WRSARQSSRPRKPRRVPRPSARSGRRTSRASSRSYTSAVATERKIAGYEILLQKQSAVDASGNLRQDPIDGVLFRAVRPVPHEDGNVAEVARAAWPEVTEEIVQVYITTTLPGRIRAWGLHQASTDRLFDVKGFVSIVV